MLIVFIFFLISGIIFYKYIKSRNVNFEKIADIVISIIFFVPLIIFYLDYYDIVSKTILKNTNSVDTQKWLEYLFNYTSVIIGSIFSAVVLYYVTKMQINKSNNDSINRDLENARIQNLPLLKYDFTNKVNDIHQQVLSSKIKNGNDNLLGLIIKNVGLNVVRNCFCEIKSNVLTKNYFLNLEDQSPIVVNDELTIGFYIKLNDENFNFKIDVYYQDLLCNWYKQELIVNFQSTYSEEINYSIKVEKEIKLNEQIEINNIKN